MRILLISSAFSGLTQRFYTELEDAGYIVSVELHLGDDATVLEGVSLFKPDLILCPFLTKRLSKDIYQNYKCLIVHPGIKGDRGPSSLDWAIQNGEPEWGVSLLEAAEEMDAGAIWANKTFPLRQATKSSIFYREVTQAAIDCLWEVLTYFDAPDFNPDIQDYRKPGYTGKLQPSIKQTDRAINWKTHKTDDILRRINAADGSPGVLDEIYGTQVFLFNAHKDCQLTGKPGEIIATANHAICRATIDGAIWIGHLQPKLASGAKGIKLPALFVLKDLMPKTVSSLKALLSKTIKPIDIDYSKPGRQLPCQEIWYELDTDVAYLYFPFHNGGMSTEQCRLLLTVYQHVATLPVKAIVLMGGEESWSNGIHLNHIEAAASPADESWLNINAIDDLIYQIITTLDKLTISAVAGSAGAGGAIMALAADRVFAREGVIFNPHYKNMGELYGSEYWTYLLPKRVGQEMATSLTEQRLPISAKKAWRIGLCDTVLDKNHQIFTAQVKQLVNALVNDSEALRQCLTAKAKTRCYDESLKALATYRKFELTQMYANFYGNDNYHSARQNFVFKTSNDKSTPANLARHRQQEGQAKKLSLGSMYHFVWQDFYQMNDALIDSQHQELFHLANQLVASASKEELTSNIKLIVQHVTELLMPKKN
ncbi:MAG: enoyl-CoA hydratase-related protein [Methylococcaceae bacterium]|nr:enoyl-CoA hydratase-related protein [Methylococcaceae bacterium]MDZ4155293.1 enoyl-CoA hydratase-related protein [Methylococcales bacterium]MDP2393905.1 enoyl-CoA hydratase-related protein [Methylococcaceae bacterium]MDP3018108.1 enoyl-CoA hydratase-related protein [Methylococcaceae bacterium]MDP3391782.1 enoyl-CoA hydratase-related protein [Methylococcaceae bacterium]